MDGPAGSQVPQAVADAMTRYLLHTNANTHGPFPTSAESDAIVADTHAFVADLLQVDDPDEIAFGPNMTTLTLGLSRAIGSTWREGDEIVVTRLDHDANVWPWVQAARDAGATVKWVELRPEDGTLDLDSLDEVLCERTRLVAVGAASNALGTVNPVAEVVRRAHAVNAQVFVDAVHYAPHRRIDVGAWDCDYLACSAYKFFGPHVGILWGRRALLETLPAYRVRPAGSALPGKWMTGTQSFEGIAGTRAALDYLAWLGGGGGRRGALDRAFEQIQAHETRLALAMLDVFAANPEVTVWGISDPARVSERVATFGITVRGVPSSVVARRLGEQGVFVWPGHFYAVECIRALGLEPEGLVRIGALHYNTIEEVARVGEVLAGLEREG
jgi:cysteine desulfurase family protein (TIGR01976 family)